MKGGGGRGGGGGKRTEMRTYSEIQRSPSVIVTSDVNQVQGL